jgi:hypothetical protein
LHHSTTGTKLGGIGNKLDLGLKSNRCHNNLVTPLGVYISRLGSQTLQTLENWGGFNMATSLTS